MRIGIDARMMTPKASRGIGRYTEEMIRALLALAPEHRYVLVTQHAIHAFSSHPSVETVVANIPWYGVQEQLRMPGVLRSLKADVIHVPHWNVPLLTHGDLVVTIHDLLLRHEPSSARVSTRRPLVAAVKRIGFRATVFATMHKANAILVPTDFVAEDIKRFYPFASKKIVVTGEGMGKHERFAPHATDSRPPQSRYLLYIGSAYPHKGLDLLLDAWKDLELQHPELRLKIAGAEDVFMRRLKDDVRHRKLPRIDFLDYVKEEDLYDLYRDAAAFVFPSRFEGFGLPPLEAIQAGCPVVCSDAAALPEVLGPDAAFFFQSGSRTDILRAIETVLRDPVAAREKTARALPSLRARHDWKATAERTLAIYQSLPPWRHA
ncbi:MAG: glycosyltransferase family 1 protein [Patescibacteria group bacterium]|jgi:glycosyltransferase involved in cell wall biosynthesis